MINNSKDRIMKEISRIDDLINVAKPFLHSCQFRKIDFEVISTAAMTMHSFYNGIDSIGVLILKIFGDNTDKDKKWHKYMVEALFGANSLNRNILRKELFIQVVTFMSFRHVARNTYATELKWEKMKILVYNLEETWTMIKSDFEKIIEEN